MRAIIRMLMVVLISTSAYGANDGGVQKPKSNRQCISMLGAMAQFKNHTDRKQFDSDYSWTGLQAAKEKLFVGTTDEAVADLEAIADKNKSGNKQTPDWVAKNLSKQDREKVVEFLKAASDADDRGMVIGLRLNEPYEIEEFRAFLRDLKTEYLLEASNRDRMQEKIERRIPAAPGLFITLGTIAAAYGLEKLTEMKFNHALVAVTGVVAGSAILARHILLRRHANRHIGAQIDPSVELSSPSEKEHLWVETWDADMSLGGINRTIAASSIQPSTPNQVVRGATDYNDYWKTIVSIAQIDQQSLMEHPKFRDRDLVASKWIVISGTNADGTDYINVAVVLKDMTTSPQGGESGPPPWMGRHLGIDEREPGAPKPVGVQ